MIFIHSNNYYNIKYLNFLMHENTTYISNCTYNNLISRINYKII